MRVRDCGPGGRRFRRTDPADHRVQAEPRGSLRIFAWGTRARSDVSRTGFQRFAPGDRRRTGRGHPGRGLPHFTYTYAQGPPLADADRKRDLRLILVMLTSPSPAPHRLLRRPGHPDLLLGATIFLPWLVHPPLSNLRLPLRLHPVSASWWTTPIIVGEASSPSFQKRARTRRGGLRRKGPARSPFGHLPPVPHQRSLAFLPFLTHPGSWGSSSIPSGRSSSPPPSGL